jgi:subtilisin family serine protease
MIDRTDKLNSSIKQLSMQNLFQKPAENKEDSGPRDSFGLSSFNPTSTVQESYILLPPENSEEQLDDETIINTLDELGIKPREELELIDGYVVDVNNNQKEKLQEAGFNLFDNSKVQAIPKPQEPGIDENSINESPVQEMSKEDYNKYITGLKEAGKPDGVRFDTPLASKYTGKGVTIAVLDSGIYPHPDFIQSENRLKAFVDFVNGYEIPYDDNGHGTHVTGCAAGDSIVADGAYKAPAPEADIVSLKVADAKGGGSMSNIIKGIQYCIENKDKHNIRVMNMSLGFPASSNHQSNPINKAVQAANDAGIVVIAAAGNSGPEQGTIDTPGDSPSVITVGSIDDNNTTLDPSDDKMSSFSSRGPTIDGRVKPDVVAPGSKIIAPTSPGSASNSMGKNQLETQETLEWLAEKDDEELMRIPKPALKGMGIPEYLNDAWYSKPGVARRLIQVFHSMNQSFAISNDGAYQVMDGTSMAAPMVAGIAAKMIEANPDLTPKQVGEIMRETADPLPGDVCQTDQGHGLIDPEEAIEKALALKEKQSETASDLPETRKTGSSKNSEPPAKVAYPGRGQRHVPRH